ncbi:hypothetical protein RBH29_10175 [Herbivorax sp. ANBcel31]|uniref:hypothetical protein n=1 Tax=Herbivorax sp. ANBcel31 TaxID=3069754 RepID=UPI0027B4CEE1|nr:hypothetical protein [Herbivorax sp. ANBcel31]MDQ2086790.1 hypothetical protein [Herbivorax sp. ANBcel31]
MSKSKIILNNERLKVEIDYPGNNYKGSRFDWTGFITEILLDDKYSFCTKESLVSGKGSGGIGLCNEFGIHTPLGYTSAKPKEKFPKLGIGLLTRSDESDYFFFDKYEVSPFNFIISKKSDSITFITEPSECNGYAVKMTKKISIKDNFLVIDYLLENTGSKEIITEEYCHNFISINKNPVGSGYMLNFPYDINIKEVPEVLTFNENKISLNKNPKKDFHCNIEGFNAVDNHYWELVFEPLKTGVREHSNFPVKSVALWGNTHVISPEVFIDVNIKPGKTQKWTRKYEFFTY